MTIEEVIQAAREYYRGEQNGAGGCLHIVLDDANYEEGYVTYCRDYAVECGDEAGIALADMLLQLTDEERRELTQEHYTEYATPWAERWP